MGNACGKSTAAQPPSEKARPLPSEKPVVSPSSDSTSLSLAKRAVSAAWLQKFCERTGAAKLSTSEVVTSIIKPATETVGISYAELSYKEESEGFGPLSKGYFISHAWANSFGKLVEIASDISEKDVKINKGAPFFWIDCIAINQHKVTPELTQLGDILRDATGTIAICDPWDKPVAVSRSWCLYEFLTTIQAKRELIVALSRDQQASFVAALIEHFDSVDRWISRVDARDASASMPADKAMIDSTVASTIGFERLNETVQVALKRWLRESGEALLAELMAAHGPRHERVLRLRNSLGMMLRMQQSDRVAMHRALHHCAAVLSARQEMLGETHPDTLESLSAVGMIHRVLGDGDLALQELRAAHQGFVAAHGAQHPAALRAANDLAFTLKAQGQLTQAEALLTEALTALDVALQELQPDGDKIVQAARTPVALLPADDGLGSDESGGDEPGGSRSSPQRRLDELQDVRCSLLSNLGGVLALQGRHVQALAQLEASWAAKQRLKGAKHPSSLMTGADVAMALHHKALASTSAASAAVGDDAAKTGADIDAGAQAEASRAVALQREMLAACTEVLGGDHRHTAMLLNNLAVMLEEQRWWRQDALGGPAAAGAAQDAVTRSDEAVSLFERACGAYSRSRGPGHLCTLAVLLNRGLAEAVDEQRATAAAAAAALASRPISLPRCSTIAARSHGSDVPPALRYISEHVQREREARDVLQAALPAVAVVLLGQTFRDDDAEEEPPEAHIKAVREWLAMNMAANLELLQAPGIVSV